jgi:hypothetical protein
LSGTEEVLLLLLLSLNALMSLVRSSHLPQPRSLR